MTQESTLESSLESTCEIESTLRNTLESAHVLDPEKIEVQTLPEFSNRILKSKKMSVALMQCIGTFADEKCRGGISSSIA